MKQLIAFCGKKGSGKDTAAECLLDYGFKNIKFADPLKNMCRAYFRTLGVDDLMIERYIEGDLKEIPVDILEGCSTRYFMQKIGTDFGRYMIGDKIWVNAFKRRASAYDLVTCTDVRFDNEVAAIHSMGGKVYRIVRPMPRSVDMHESETSIDSLKADGLIENDDSVVELHDKVRELMRALMRGN